MSRGRSQGMLRFSDASEFDRFKRTRSGHVDGIKPLEADVAKGVEQALDLHPRVVWHTRQNTGAGMLIRRDVFERLVAEGHLRREDARFVSFGWKGQLDRTGILAGGRRLDVEIKRPGGKATPEQQATIAAINAAGGLAFVAESAEDVFREIPL